MDRFRSREYLGRFIVRADVDSQKVEQALSPLTRLFSFEGLNTGTADDILRLIIDFHSSTVDEVAVPRLIEALKTENADVRLRIHRALMDLQTADFEARPPPQSLIDWVPAIDESPGQIGNKVSEWQDWWQQTDAPLPHS